jgi:alanine racemase
MFETSSIELDRSLYHQNIDFLKRSVAHKSKLCLVVKGNAYGHGIKEILTMAQEVGVHFFSVFNAWEAREALEYLDKDSRLLIMGDIDHHSIDWVLINKIEFHCHNIPLLERALIRAKEINARAKIHLEFETGMNRLGLEMYELEKVIELLQKYPEQFSLNGYCTHFAGAESITNFVRVKKQIKTYEKICALLEARGFDKVTKHAACSAAAIRLKKTRLDMVRIGILQYGFWPSQETFIE